MAWCELCGTGIGRVFPAGRQIPHYGRRGRGQRSKGMCFTIKPMINQGVWQIEVLDDGWTALTQDKKRSAQFEHTLLVTENGYEIMTLREGETFE